MNWRKNLEGRNSHCGSANIGKLVISNRTVEDKDGNKKTLTRRVWNCKECKKQFTVKVGTIFEDSALGLEKWLPCVWLIVNAKNGISSCEIGRTLGVMQRTLTTRFRMQTAMSTGTAWKTSGACLNARSKAHTFIVRRFTCSDTLMNRHIALMNENSMILAGLLGR